MRKPYLASAQKRNRTRLLKKGPGNQTSRRARRHVSPRLPVARPEAGPSSAASEAAKSTALEVAAHESARCGFGATRVGALLGRVRLHLQTDRFLAAHRGDAVWEAGCLRAALALADVVSGMPAEEMGAPLASSEREKGVVITPLFAPDNTKTAGPRGARQQSGATLAAGSERGAR